MSSKGPRYRVRNLTSERRVAAALQRADTFFARTLGLMGSASLPAEGGLWLDPCTSIHMFFMRYAIDVIFLDTSLRVTRAIKGLRPWTIALGGRGACSVLELPVGTIARSATQKGDSLAIEPLG
jgi:uncharacterized membrane protein (UPF0127 family)